MDDQNEGLKERWNQPGHVPERGYAGDEPEVERRTAAIRSDIDQTRADMTETIDAIQEKLRPGHVVSQATETVRNATVGRVKEMARGAREALAGDSRGSSRERDGLGSRIRNNPIPFVTAAASLAWIAFSGSGTRRRSPAIYGSTRGPEPFIRETTIAEYEDRDEDVAAGAGYGVADARERTRSAARESGRRIRHATSRAQSGMQQFVRRNPLAAGGVAAALGAAIGMAFPKTERENELMGDTRDAVIDRAKDAAGTAAERVKDAARQVQDVATDAATKLTGDA